MKPRHAYVVIPLIATALSASLLYFFDAFPIMPTAATQEAVSIDRAFQACLVLTVVIFSIVSGAVLFMLAAFRQKPNAPMEEGAPVHHSRGWWFESLWVSVSVVLTVGLAWFGWQELKIIYGPESAEVNVQVTASQFSWDFFYPEFSQLGSRLYLPQGKRVRLLLTSKDVIHSFWVPEFRMKQDAVPGLTTSLYFTPQRLGTYELLCNQLCGRDHTVMTSVVEVVPEDVFVQKFKSQEEAW